MDVEVRTIHFFLVDLTNSGNYYQLAIEGDTLENSTCILQKYFQDVRYLYSKQKKDRDGLNGKRNLEDLSVRSCRHAYDIGKKLKESRYEILPDSRHHVVHGQNI